MKVIIATALSTALLAMSAPAYAAGLTEAAELEAARANARAGGPNSERDAELLSRYGCSSGTRSVFCAHTHHSRRVERERGW
jgi:hypothetical protein